MHSARNPISCKTEGPIRLLGMEDANAYNSEDYKDNTQNAYKGRLLVYIQSLDKKGKGKITLTSPNLKTTKLQIDIVSDK